MTIELDEATAAYWNAKTPAEEREAYSRMRAAGAPPSYGEDEAPAMRPFADVFPAANIHHHFVGQDQAKGVYAKELHIPAGFRLVSHSHEYDHLSIIASGVAILTVDGSREHSRSTKKLVGPCAVTIKAGKYHTLNAMTDLVWFCIHPTDETDAAKVDDAILKPD